MLLRLCGFLVSVGGCAAYAPAVPLFSSRPVGPSRCDAPRLDYEDSAMKDINRVGVSDKRQQEINELMNKLRGRGSVGSSSDTGDSERFLARPRPANPVELAARELAVKEDVSGPEVAAEALAASSSSAAASAATAAGEQPATTTTGIGGTWTPPPPQEVEKETHKPKVSTWGVYERPADISKAFGGGRQIGVGGYQPTEEEVAKKRAETEALLAAFTKSLGADIELQEAHRDEILAATKEAKQMLRYGRRPACKCPPRRPHPTEADASVRAPPCMQVPTTAPSPHRYGATGAAVQQLESVRALSSGSDEH